MSVLEHMSEQIQVAAKELREIQETRKKVNMDEGNFNALATVIRAFHTEGQCDQQYEAPVSITTHLGHLALLCGYIYLPCDLILYGSCFNNTITVYFKDHSPFKKIILEMPSIQEVDNFISRLKLPQKPPSNTDQDDGNVTSSSEDSDSGTSDTKEVNNSFDSDDPSATGDL